MAGLIKNQILKHLSKFAKNLSHDQIHLSTLKGEGELKNLQLNEEVLTELLELPSWLRLSAASCNRVAVRIQWTKLKNVPIHLSLDEVRVEVETCEDLRPMNVQSRLASYASGGQYGFSDKVVDGITLTVNSVLLTLKSRAFIASFQMSRIVLESKAPTWAKTDLRMTRVKDTDRGELLIFKELSWQTVRIEAKSTVSEDLTPLRLITNQARCRITIKKKLSDCSVLGCRLVLIMEDLLWVLTDDQLKAALHFADSLSGLLKRATEQTQKIKGARKLESLSESQDQMTKDKSAKKKAASANVSAKVFSKYDVVETSYHFYSDRIDLHLCDDPGGKGRSCHPELDEGGAFQVSLSQLQVDFYPYHLANGDRSAWIRYNADTCVHTGWLETSLKQFQTTLLETSLNMKDVKHAPLSRATPASQPKPKPPSNNTETDSVSDVLVCQFRKLLTTNLVVRLNNFTLWKVSTSKVKAPPKEFVTGDREKFSLPDDMPVMHFEYTQFYYPGNTDFPLPAPKLFAYFNPILLNVDPLTVLWLNAFALNLQRSVKMLSVEQTDPPYLDVKIEAIMFRVIVEAIEDAQHQRQRDRPRALHIQASRVLCANYRSLETGSKADLAKCLESFQNSSGFFFGTDFPNTSVDIPVVCDKMIKHATGADGRVPSQQHKPAAEKQGKHSELWPIMRKDLLWTESKDVWYVHLDPLWADFQGTPSVAGSRPIPFIDAFPASLWLYKQEENDLTKKPPPVPKRSSKVPLQKKASCSSSAGGTVEKCELAKMHLLVHITNLVSAQLNHYQFLFLLRLLETVSEITTFLTQDVSYILGEEDESSMALGLIAPQVDLSLLMPSGSQSRDKISAAAAASGDFTVTEDTMANNMYSLGEVDRRATPQNRTATPSLISMGSSTPVSPCHSLPTASSVPNIPNTSNSGTATPRATPSIHLSTPKDALQEKKKHSLTSSLTNMMAQLDNSIRGGAAAAVTTPTSEEDLLSVKSDDSDADSECFVVINQAVDDHTRDNTLFAINSKRGSPDVEVAAEAMEEVILSSVSAQDLSSKSPSVSLGPMATTPVVPEPRVRDGIISVATFHVGRLELAQQSVGNQACIKVQAASLSGEECPAISWEEFQSKFTVRSKGWSESTRNQTAASWVLKLRFNTTAPNYDDLVKSSSMLSTATMSLREKISRAAEAFVDVQVQNLPLQFYLSTLDGLADLFEDEIIPTPIPMKIQLDNLALHLVEDRPSKNITSPGSLPIDVAIPSLLVTRDRSGLFSVQPGSGTYTNAHASLPEVSQPSHNKSHGQHMDLVRSGEASIEEELQQRASILAVDNANLRTLLDQTNGELQALRSRVTEFDTMQKKLVKMQQQVLANDKENKNLKQTLRYLQQELVKSGKKVPLDGALAGNSASAAASSAVGHQSPQHPP